MECDITNNNVNVHFDITKYDFKLLESINTTLSKLKLVMHCYFSLFKYDPVIKKKTYPYMKVIYLNNSKLFSEYHLCLLVVWTS